MFSITLKRSVATLGVVAGLLAAAGPASAKTMAEDSLHAANTPDAWAWHEAARTGIHDAGTPIRADSNEVAVEGLTLIREPAHAVTMLDYENSAIVTYSLEEPQRVTIDLVEELGADS